MMKKNWMLLMLTGVLFACGSEETTTEETDRKVVQNCIYEYNPVQSKLDWTAYKFLSKAGVGGTFKEIRVEGDTRGGDPKAIISSLSFSIPITSIETNDPSRNGKIQNFFFGSLENTELISGRVVSLGDDGKAVLAITMNGITQDVEGSYTLEDNVFTYNTEIDVLNWNAEAGLTALNTECEGLHTDIENGDTESKLWPDVTISFTTSLTKNCD